MTGERWLRFLPRTALQFVRNGDGLMVFVPIQPWHYAELGVATQSELSGVGEIDSKVITTIPDGRQWSHSQAYEYCLSELRKLIDCNRDSTRASLSELMKTQVETLEGRKYGRQIVLLNGQISQEIILPKSVWGALVEQAGYDIEAFCFLEEIGLNAITTRTLDIQPDEFRHWFLNVASNSIRAPGKRPKKLSIYSRDRLIVSLVSQLDMRGISPTTSNLECIDLSGCGIVARAVVASGLKQPRSYNGVIKLRRRIQRY